MSDISKYYKVHEKLKENLSLAQLERVVDSIDRVLEEVPKSESIDELLLELKPIWEILDKACTSKLCPHCGQFLLVSDLPQYDYVCSSCDENFYECEVKDFIKIRKEI